jgi:YesN/AraC family two-component response regulator
MEKIQETNIQILKQCSNGNYMSDDLLLIDNLRDVPVPESARRTNFIMIGLCLQGEAQYSVDTREFSIHQNDFFIVSERHVLDHFQLSHDFEAHCMVVSISFFHEIIKNVSEMSALFLYSRNHPVMQYDEKEQTVFKNYYEVIRSRIADKSNHFQKELIGALMLAMFYDLSNVIYRTREVNEKSQSRPDAIFTQFIKMVEEHCKSERRVSWYAKQLDITPKYLSETVKQVSMRTPNEWIDNYVTLEIRVLLKNTTKSIKEITSEMNFPNQSFLGKYFKENVGMSPSKYRKS